MTNWNKRLAKAEKAIQLIRGQLLIVDHLESEAVRAIRELSDWYDQNVKENTV